MAAAAPTANRRRTMTMLASAAAAVFALLAMPGGGPRAETSVGQAASPVAPAAASTPALWAVEIDRYDQTMLRRAYLARLRSAGINALVLDPRRLSGVQLVRARAAAAATRLLAVEVMPRVHGPQTRAGRAVRKACGSAHEPASLRCAVLANSRSAALRLARRARSSLVAIRLSGPTGLTRLRRAAGPGRIVALVRLSSHRHFPAKAWKAAIAAAAANPNLDLAVSPSGRSKERAMDQYLALLKVESPGPSPPPPPPPSPPPWPPSPPPPPPPPPPVPPVPLPPPSVFLSPSGSDANPCTQAAPCRTMNHGYEVSQPGQLVELAAGNYGDQYIARITARDGLSPGCAAETPVNCVSFHPAPGADVSLGDLTIQASNVRVVGDVLNGPQPPQSYGQKRYDLHARVLFGSSEDGGFDGNQNHVVVQELDAGAFEWGPAAFLQLLGGDYGPGDAAQGATENKVGPNGTIPNDWPHDILLDGLFIHDQQTSNNQAHMGGLFLISGYNFTLRNNFFTRDVVYDVFFQDFNQYVGGWNSGPVHDVLIENNWFGQPVDCLAPCGNPSRGNGQAALQFDPFSYDAGVSPCGKDWCNILIRYNSFGSASIDFGGNHNDGGAPSWSNVRLVGNVGEVPSAEPTSLCSGPAGITLAYDVWFNGSCGATDVTGSPSSYVTPSTGAEDLHLTGGVAVDRVPGANGDQQLDVDIDGQTRPLGPAWDAGSDETR